MAYMLQIRCVSLSVTYASGGMRISNVNGLRTEQWGLKNVVTHSAGDDGVGEDNAAGEDEEGSDAAAAVGNAAAGCAGFAAACGLVSAVSVMAALVSAGSALSVSASAADGNVRILRN